MSLATSLLNSACFLFITWACFDCAAGDLMGGCLGVLGWDQQGHLSLDCKYLWLDILRHL